MRHLHRRAMTARPDHWLQLAVAVSPREAGQVESLLQGCGALAVTLEDGGQEERFETTPRAEAVLWARTRVVGLFPPAHDLDAVLDSLRRGLGLDRLPPHRIVRLPEQDWERVWLERFHPMRFGRSLWICPGDHAPPDPEGVNLFLDPGLAFGTGTHPTTALCLEWLDATDLAGATVLDYGCGSGILAVAAARLGAATAWATDIDPQALAATRANAARNGVAECVRTTLPEELPPLQADCLLANILADPLRSLAPRLAGCLRVHATLVLSGILARQAEETITAYRPWFHDFHVSRREEWVRITALRKEA